MQRTNVVGIETPHGYRLVELVHGDLLSGGVSADVLVVSAFAGDYLPTPGSLVGQLQRAWGVDLEVEAARTAVDLRASFGCWVTRELDELGPFERVLVAEMRRGEWDPLDAVKHVFVTLAALEASGVAVDSVAMPILGAGEQGLSSEDVMPELLVQSEAAVKRQVSLRRVSFVERDDGRAKALSEAMDGSLRRAGVTLPRSDVIASLQRDLENVVADLALRMPAGHEPLVQDLHRLASGSIRSSHEAGVVGRRAAEFVVDDLLDKAKPRTGLLQKIEALADLGVSPWIRGYLHTLRQFGNEGAHQRSTAGRLPSHVDRDDVAIGMFCLLRVLVFWNDVQEVPAPDLPSTHGTAS